MRFLLLVLLGCCGSVAKLQAQAISLADTSLVRCVVKSMKATYQYREPMLFDVQLINQTNQPVMLIDGLLNSEVWEDFAELRIEAYPLGKHRTGATLNLEDEPGSVSFGTTRQNFVLIQPNQPHSLLYAQKSGGLLLSSSSIEYQPLKPGDYALRFIYLTATRERRIENNMTSLDRYSKPYQDELRSLLDQVPAVRAVSAPVLVTVTR